MIVLPNIIIIKIVMDYNKKVIIDGKTIDVLLEGSGSLTNTYGRLQVDKYKEQENIVYRSWNIQLEKTTQAEERDNSGRDEVQIMFNLNQDISWTVNNKKIKTKTSFSTGSEQVDMARGEVCVFRNNNYSTSMSYQAGVNISLKSLQMPTPFFSSLLSKYFSNQDISALEEKFLTRVTKTLITPEMYRVLAEIDTSDRFKEYEGVYAEGKMIELTALVLYGIAYHKTDEIKRLPMPSKIDLERIEGLREEIQRRPALEYDAPTVANELGMSVSKLNRLFRNLYATSLHSYVQDKRLECAARLIKESDLPVSEAAIKAGYSNMSHFSKSFLKKYGVLPRNF